MANNEEKLMNNDSKTKCTCGCTRVMLPTVKYAICKNCGKRINNRSKARFRYEMWKWRNDNEK